MGKKNGHLRGKQRYRCQGCSHQWVEQRGKRVNYLRYYHDWLFGRRTLTALCDHLSISYPTLQKHFDGITCPEGVIGSAPPYAINLLVDATFFGRDYGFLCFHDTHHIIYLREITTETVQALRQGLLALKEAGYRIKSVTIDGRRGYYPALRKMLGPVPIQMCLYHQKAIVRRYITDHPKSLCGQELRALMKSLCVMGHSDFINALYALIDKHRGFLEERNEKKEFKHQALPSRFPLLNGKPPATF